MDNTSYVIEVQHNYENGNGGSNVEPKTEKTVVEPKNNRDYTIGKEADNILYKSLKSTLFATSTFALGLTRAVGDYTGDYGVSRGISNAIKGFGTVISFSNPYTAAMSIMGISSGIASTYTKKRDNDLRANTLKQISGGINNGYRGRKL